MTFNPYADQMLLFVANADKGAMGQFMRDFGDDLEGFAGGEDIKMVAVSEDGNGPPDGWIFASWVTEVQGEAFRLHPELPGTVETDHWPVGTNTPTVWLTSLTPPMQIIVEE